MKYALITGANKGIGFEIARQLAKKGYHVFLTARNAERGKEATGKLRAERMPVEFIQMDVGDEASIKQAFRKVQAQIGQVDVLINNAAIVLEEGSDMLGMGLQALRDTFNVNALGPFYVCRIFEPLLKEGSRVINMSSSAGRICGGMNAWVPGYSASKTALNAITIHLARSFESRGVVVNAVCPGWVRTEMGGAGADRSVPKGAETPVWLATKAPLSETGKFFRDKKEISW